MKHEEPIIIGIDPGTTITGYGIIRVKNPSFETLDYGCIKPPAHFKLSDRYLTIFEALEKLLEQYAPDCLVVETQYLQKNFQSVLKLGMARGIAILAGKRRGLPVFEYSPTRAKKAVVGNGSASKQQVQKMIQCLLHLPKLPTPEDAADALALAICHAQSSRFGAKTTEV